MAIHVTPIPKLTEFATPAITLGTAAGAGSALSTIRSDSGIVAFNAATPDAITYGQSGQTGSANFASRIDHAHGMAAAGASMATGTYTGDGSTSMAVTGVGFTVKMVYITERETSSANAESKSVVWTSDVIVDDEASGMAINIDKGGGVTETRTNAIIALGADGFTVDDAGSDGHPNKDGQVYNYWAIG